MRCGHQARAVELVLEALDLDLVSKFASGTCVLVSTSQVEDSATEVAVSHTFDNGVLAFLAMVSR